MALTTRARAGLVSAMIVSAALLGCTGGPQREAAVQEAAPESRVREVYTFSSLDTMLATADAVAVVTVLESGAGRTVGDPGAELTFTEVRVAIDEVLMGRLGPEVTLEIDSPADWTKPGEQSLIILHQKEDAASDVYYRPLNSQSVFRLNDSSLVAATSDPFAVGVADLGLTGLRLEIARALPLIRAGDIAPAETLPRADDAGD